MIPRSIPRFRVLPVVSALLVAAAVPAQLRNVSGGELIPAQACYDVLHYDLTIEVTPSSRRIDGRLAMRAYLTRPTNRLALDLDSALHVSAVQLDGKEVGFAHERGRIFIEVREEMPEGKEITVAVDYGGEPVVAVNPPWRGGFTWAKTPSGADWIATSCQGEGADLWWPCKDHPSDKPDGFDLHVTVPEGLVVASNGTLRGEPVTHGGKTTFDWHSASPISNYCVALNIAPYVELRDTYTSCDRTKIPITFYVLPESEEKAKRCMPGFLDNLRFLEETLGPYPFRNEKYGIAETPFLGMEHQTIIAYGNGFEDPDYDWLHLHELGHEWWGNLVTCRDWKDMWIHEGFGTYMQPLYLESRFGHEAYLAEMKRQRTMNRAPVAPRASKNSAEIYFAASGNDIYYKGSWVLHTLRWLLGDERFFLALRRFCYPTEAARRATDGSQVHFADTEDFVSLVDEIAGEDLGWFFEVYLRQPRLPRLIHERSGDRLRLRWSLPGDLRFELPVPIEIDGKEVKVAMPEGRGEIEVGNAEWRVDPGFRILMTRDSRRR